MASPVVQSRSCYPNIEYRWSSRGARARLVYILYMTYLWRMSTAHEDFEVTVTDARGQLPELLDTRVRDGGVVYLTRYGRRVGAVVPADVAEHLAELEDAYWAARAEQVLAKGEPTLSWDEAMAKLEAGDTDL